MIGNDAFRERLRTLISGETLFDEMADRHTSLGVGGRIDALVFPKSEEELLAVVGFLWATQTPYLPVGNWTNLIVTGKGYRGVLVSLGRLGALKQRDDGEGGVFLEAEAGVALSEMVRFTMLEALTGMEFCAGIPGSVGGAIRMNAGAYGSEIKDVVNSVRLLDSPGEIRTQRRDILRFQYRTLDLPAETIIIGAEFHLQRGERGMIAGRVREILEMRAKKHPLEYRNAGSVFKNPRDIPAGRLIDEAGLKGTRIGDAQVSEKHGNFIVNRGRATAEEILRLIALIREKVFETRGYTLETELRIIGD
jgi:UDP-N-acetylmuramate dehydrogenase